MQFNYETTAAAVRAHGSLARATNIYGDLLYSQLKLRGIESDWQPTLNNIDPKLRFTLQDGYLERGACAIVLHAVGERQGQWIWNLTLDFDDPMQAMANSDRLRMDFLINALMDWLHNAHLMDSWYDS